jgi:uncharacterized protein YtpQ (UPF0354 family)
MSLHWKWLVVACCLVAVPFLLWRMQKAKRVGAEFRAQVAEVLKEHYPDRAFQLGSDPNTIELDDLRFNLSNLLRDFQTKSYDHKERQKRIVDCFELSLQDVPKINGLKTGSASWVKAAEVVNVQLAPADFGKTQDLLSRPFVDDVSVYYVLDVGSSVLYVSREQQQTWGVTADAVHETALRNLDKISKDLDLEVTRSGDGRGQFLAVDVRDAYAAARLASPEFRKRMALLLGERFYAAVPNTEFLVAWSLDYSRHEAFVRKVADDFRTRPHPISPDVVLVTTDGVQLFSRP